MPRTPRPTITTHYRNRTWADWCNSPFTTRTAKPTTRNARPLMLPLANYVAALLPGLGMPRRCHCWQPAHPRAVAGMADSTTKKVKFVPLPKKHAVKIFHKARAFERQTRQKGKQDGALGRNGLLVLHTLIFDFLNYATGRLDPAIETIARKAAISISSAKRGLANLKRPACCTGYAAPPKPATRKAASASSRIPTPTASCRRRSGSVSSTEGAPAAASRPNGEQPHPCPRSSIRPASSARTARASRRSSSALRTIRATSSRQSSHHGAAHSRRQNLNKTDSSD